ncbi:MAG: hypothetical protein M5U12_38325 [Verrucomicrobia bacterium]|nr:hypothetical protein [Verrucomicrobiota bacterium]
MPYRYSLREALPWWSGEVRPGVESVGCAQPDGECGHVVQPGHQPPGPGADRGGHSRHQGQFPSAGDVTDRPCPAITVMGQGQFKVRLTGGTGAAFAEKGRAYDLDQPCPTILGTKPNQFRGRDGAVRDR